MDEKKASAVSAAPDRKLVVWITLALFAIPAAYLAAARPRPEASQTPVAQANAADAGAELSRLQALAQADPSEANRLNLSQAYIHRGMNSSAITLLNALVTAFPGSALGWNNLCVAHTQQQEYSLAIAACEAGLRADGSIPLLHNNLKWAQDERDKVSAAVASEEAAPMAARNAAFYLTLGLNQLHLGAYDQAIAAWQQCLQLAPRNGDARNDIGVALMLESQPARAETSFREALAMEPDNVLFRNNLDWALSEAGAAK